MHNRTEGVLIMGSEVPRVLEYSYTQSFSAAHGESRTRTLWQTLLASCRDEYRYILEPQRAWN